MQFALSAQGKPDIRPERMFYFDADTPKPQSVLSFSEYLATVGKARSCGYAVQDNQVKCTRLSGRRNNRYYLTRSIGINSIDLAELTANTTGNFGDCIYSTLYTDLNPSVALTDQQAVEKFASTFYPDIPRNASIQTFGYSFLNNPSTGDIGNPVYQGIDELYPDTSITCIPFDFAANTPIKMYASQSIAAAGAVYRYYSYPSGYRYYDVFPAIDFVQPTGGKQATPALKILQSAIPAGEFEIGKVSLKQGVTLQVSGNLTRTSGYSDNRAYGQYASNPIRATSTGGSSSSSEVTRIVPKGNTGGGNLFISQEGADFSYATLAWAMLAVRHEGRLKYVVLDSNDFTHSTPALPNDETVIDLHLAQYANASVYAL